MEVCGTHTMAIAKYGLRNYFKGVDFISGPGCPVCVTPSSRLEQCVELARKKNVITVTFGDLLRVPAVTSSLQNELTRGADVKVIYSVYEPLNIALSNPKKEVVFLGAGFETTAPLAAALIKSAKQKKIKNLSVFSMFKSVFPAVETLCKDKEIKVDGFLLPGNVAAITGSDNFNFISDKYAVACVVAGFLKDEITDAANALIALVKNKKTEVINKYSYAVSSKGNTAAKILLNEVFFLKNDIWRGFGVIENSGFGISDKYASFDADKKFSLKKIAEPKDKCLCGQIMKGLKSPADCKLFGKKCFPQNPVGPCMVSSEGVCAAHFKYR
ncbi:hydrogenase formation protein HypD [Endomicrobium proavitum]|nr:hydrogenase formation protein HypD [Endomicrobium proavitum]